MDDGERYEPKHYAPIIPYVLCESNHLPATGWKVDVYARDLNAIFKNLRALLKGEIDKCGVLPMDKYNFKGDMRKYKDKKYFVGNYEYDEEENTVTITELPPGTFSKRYLGVDNEAIKKEKKKKDAGEEASNKGISKKPLVDDYKDLTDESVKIKIWLKPDAYELISKDYGNSTFDCFEEYFELKESINDKINLVDQNDNVIEYKNYEDVFMDWYKYRKALYTVRVERNTILNDLEIKMLLNMQRFSKERNNYKFTEKTPEEKIIEILQQNKYDIFNSTLLNNPKYTEVKDLIPLITSPPAANYNYLIDMSLRDMSERSCLKRQEKINELIEYKNLLIEDEKTGLFRGAKVWERELNELEEAIVEGRKTKWFYGEDVEYIYDAKTKTTKKITKKSKTKTTN
jgi:DNA topoisomerase-2